MELASRRLCRMRHSHYNYEHQVDTQLRPRVSCGCDDLATLFSIFFVTGLKEFRRQREARVRFELGLNLAKADFPAK
jgi:hypothetical protein